MIIVDFFGFSGAGKSYSAKQLATKYTKMNSSFLYIANQYRIVRLMKKIYYIFFTSFSDLKIILELHKLFNYKSKYNKIKNIISFLYLIGYIKSQSSKTNILLLDHGFVQCLLSCFLFSVNNKYDLKKITQIVSKLFTCLDIYYDYYNLIVMEHDWEIIDERLKKREGHNSKKLIKKNKINFYNKSLANCKFVYDNISYQNFENFEIQFIISDNYDKFINTLKDYEK